MPVAQDHYASRVEEKPEIRRRMDPVIYDDPARPNGPLSADELRRYERKGYLFFEKLFKEREVAALLKELERLKTTPDRRERPEYITEPGSGAVRSIFRIHRESSLFGRLMRDPRVLNVARQLLGSEVYIHQSRVNFKPGFVGKEFYWHSDFETWHVEDGMPRMRAVSCSVTLTPNTLFNGPLMIIPGSHTAYITCVGTTPEDHYKQSLKKQEYGVPDAESLSRITEAGGIEAPVGPAGSAVFFDCNAMHGSNGNITPLPRTNAFFVYNSVENRLGDPAGGIRPRPEFIATREGFEQLSPAPFRAD
ncbi:MAG: ectoine hydroxylase [Candidatus Omnitrophica bacterium CG11_big_fil_rev_8_21_14_0_20_64_10]|nr:MAG: ectoine hydroxylase [Candidatus Omnitrophica bacterium CG11_big_fil_rev_8_21_14_0_20_64_10]